MAYVQADLDRINRAISLGVLSVNHNGRLTTYRSMEELIQARDVIAAELSPKASTDLSPRYQQATFND